MKLFGLFGAKRFEKAAHKIYFSLVEQARQPGFYLSCGAPDTVDGRFDMIVLHAFLLLRRLKKDHEKTAELAQELFDRMFADMDQNLREMGVGDLGVGKRIKGMAEAFYGRAAAYEAGLGANDGTLAEALRRNLYRKTEPDAGQLAAMAAYMRDVAARLDGAGINGLMAGNVVFGPAPAPPAETRK